MTGEKTNTAHTIRSFSCQDGPSPSDGGILRPSLGAQYKDYAMKEELSIKIYSRGQVMHMTSFISLPLG